MLHKHIYMLLDKASPLVMPNFQGDREVHYCNDPERQRERKIFGDRTNDCHTNFLWNIIRGTLLRQDDGMFLQKRFAFVSANALGHYQSKASFSSWPEVFIIIPVIYKTSFLKCLGGRSVWVEPVSGSPLHQGCGPLGVPALWGGVSPRGISTLGRFWIFCFCLRGHENCSSSFPTLAKFLREKHFQCSIHLSTCFTCSLIITWHFVLSCQNLMLLRRLKPKKIWHIQLFS